MQTMYTKKQQKQKTYITRNNPCLPGTEGSFSAFPPPSQI